MRRDPRSIILEPVTTEKTTQRRHDTNEVAFVVARDANKIDIRNAVRDLFNVDVVAVRTIRVPGKVKRLGRSEGRRPGYKKAIVKLKEGQTIEFFEHA